MIFSELTRQAKNARVVFDMDADDLRVIEVHVHGQTKWVLADLPRRAAVMLSAGEQAKLDEYLRHNQPLAAFNWLRGVSGRAAA